MLKWKVEKGFKDKLVSWTVVEIILAVVTTVFIYISNLHSYVTLEVETMREIWEHQITITSVITTILLFFIENANDRRLGMSYKYIFYHKEIFGYGNIEFLSLINILHLLSNFLCAYILCGINLLWLQRGIRAFFVISLITNILCLIRFIELFYIARYKESMIYKQIRKKRYEIMSGEKKNEDKKSEFKIVEKIKKNTRLDCDLVMKNKEYDSYYGDAILTLFTLYFMDEEGNISLLDCIAARIVQRDVGGIDDKENFIRDLKARCKEESTLEGDMKVIEDIEKKTDMYFDYLNKKVNEFKTKLEQENSKCECARICTLSKN